MSLSFTFRTLAFTVSLLSWNHINAQGLTTENRAKTLSSQGLGNDSILTAFSRRFIRLDSLLNHTEAIEDHPISIRPFSTDTLDSVYETKRIHEHKAFKRKSGLELTGQTYYRLDDKFGFDEENDQYSRYKAKLQGEVGWNIFNSSFLQRKSALHLIDLDNQAELLQQKDRYTERTWSDAEAAIERKYDALIVSVLREQLQNINVLNMAYQFTLENDRSSNEKLLEAMNEQIRIEHAITQVDREEGEMDLLPMRPVIPAAIEIDSVKLFDYLLENNTKIQAAHIQEETLGTQRKLTNYAHEMRFTPFVRVSHYFRVNAPSSTNAEAGVRFTFPLYNDTRGKRNAMLAEQKAITLGRQELSENLLGQCRRLLSQFDRINTAIRSEQQHALQLHRFIGIRKEAYLKSLNGYNHIARLEEYNEYLKSIERTYNLLRLRQLCLLNIQKAAGCTDLAQIIRTKEITE